MKKRLIGAVTLTLCGAAFAFNADAMMAQMGQNMQTQMAENIQKRAAMQQQMMKFIAQIRSLQGRPDQQVALMQGLSKKFNAADFWYCFVAEADTMAVAALWPDPSDEKVYLASKKAPGHKEDEKELDFGDAMGKALDAQSGAIEMTTKKAGTAFALKRDKSGAKIRFVETKDFSAHIVAAALLGGKTDTVKYFEAQCGGFTPDFRVAVFQAARDNALSRLELTQQFVIPLEEAKARLAKAEDKYDEEAARKTIAQYEDALRIVPPFAINNAAWKVLFHGAEAEELARCCDPGDFKNWANAKKSQFSMINGVSHTSTAARAAAGAQSGNIAQAFAGIGDLMKAQKEMEKQNQSYAQILKAVGVLMVNAVQSALPPGYTVSPAGIKWTPGTINSEIPQLQAGGKKGEWIIIPGYRKVAEKKYVWTPGMLHVDKVGFAAAKKEGQWVTLPGFKVQKSGKAVWKENLKHDRYANIVSGKKMLQWIPAPGYEWATPGKSDDYTVKPVAK